MASIKRQANDYEVSITGETTSYFPLGFRDPTTSICHAALERSQSINSKWIFHNFALQAYYLLIYNLFFITPTAGKPVHRTSTATKKK